ncbi:hypothetical protein EJ110_NYTH23677 [Nymphaea thermarum]|nr:hypothetical protein EJ110_NYTH23677 [Nymphaea thermarum]
MTTYSGMVLWLNQKCSPYHYPKKTLIMTGLIKCRGTLWNSTSFWPPITESRSHRFVSVTESHCGGDFLLPLTCKERGKALPSSAMTCNMPSRFRIDQDHRGRGLVFGGFIPRARNKVSQHRMVLQHPSNRRRENASVRAFRQKGPHSNIGVESSKGGMDRSTASNDAGVKTSLSNELGAPKHAPYLKSIQQKDKCPISTTSNPFFSNSGSVVSDGSQTPLPGFAFSAKPKSKGNKRGSVTNRSTAQLKGTDSQSAMIPLYKEATIPWPSPTGQKWQAGIEVGWTLTTRKRRKNAFSGEIDMRLDERIQDLNGQPAPNEDNLTSKGDDWANCEE